MEIIENFSITIEDLAKKHGKGQQAIRNYLDRYPEQLQGHYKRENGSTYLDNEAVAFIESKIKPKKVEYEVLNTQLEEKIRELQDKLIQAHEKNLALVEEKHKLELKVTEKEKLIESQDSREKSLIEDNRKQRNLINRFDNELQSAEKKYNELSQELEEAKEEARASSEEAEATRKELEALKSRGLWARIRNK